MGELRRMEGSDTYRKPVGMGELRRMESEYRKPVGIGELRRIESLGD